MFSKSHPETILFSQALQLWIKGYESLLDMAKQNTIHDRRLHCVVILPSGLFTK